MRVMSAHGRITGWVLVGLPPVLALVLMTINPEHRELMFGDPLGHPDDGRRRDRCRSSAR